MDEYEYERNKQWQTSNLNYKGSLRIKKCHKKWKKSIILLIPPLPQDVLDFFEVGKKLKFGDPPGPSLGKIWNWENLVLIYWYNFWSVDLTFDMSI